MGYRLLVLQSVLGPFFGNKTPPLRKGGVSVVVEINKMITKKILRAQTTFHRRWALLFMGIAACWGSSGGGKGGSGWC